MGVAEAVTLSALGLVATGATPFGNPLKPEVPDMKDPPKPEDADRLAQERALRARKRGYNRGGMSGTDLTMGSLGGAPPPGVLAPKTLIGG